MDKTSQKWLMKYMLATAMALHAIMMLIEAMAAQTRFSSCPKTTLTIIAMNRIEQ